MTFPLAVLSLPRRILSSIFARSYLASWSGMPSVSSPSGKSSQGTQTLNQSLIQASTSGTQRTLPSGIMFIYLALSARQAKKGEFALLRNRDEGGHRAFDDLATGLESGAISRSKAIKLGGAALVASALGLFASEGAQAETVTPEISRRRCNQKYRDANYCKNRQGNKCSVCCNRNSQKHKACCGPKGCNCCRKGERCLANGKCR